MEETQSHWKSESLTRIPYSLYSDESIAAKEKIDQVIVKRTLSVIYNPNRYRSKAAEAFTNEILPKFASPNFNQHSIDIQYPMDYTSLPLSD